MSSPVSAMTEIPFPLFLLRMRCVFAPLERRLQWNRCRWRHHGVPAKWHRRAGAISPFLCAWHSTRLGYSPSMNGARTRVCCYWWRRRWGGEVVVPSPSPSGGGGGGGGELGGGGGEQGRTGDAAASMASMAAAAAAAAVCITSAAFAGEFATGNGLAMPRPPPRRLICFISLHFVPKFSQCHLKLLNLPVNPSL